MPAMYESIRDRLKAKGLPLKEAKKHAAMIYNGRRKKHPAMPKLNPQHHRA